MNLDTLGLIATLVATAVGATWALRSKMSELEKSFTNLINTEREARKALEARVIILENSVPALKRRRK